jgi:hypothetical protein
MKILSYSFLALLFLTSSLVVSAQQKPLQLPNSLPDNATLAETQEWLTKVLTRNSSHIAKVEQGVKQLGGAKSKTSGYIESKISELTFKGTVLSYKITQGTQFNSGAGAQPQQQQQPQSGFPPMPNEENISVQLDLKDINPEEVTLRDIDGDENAQTLSLRTYDYKRTIKLKSSDTGNITISVATIVVNTNVSEQVQNAFLHLLKLVQEPKP